uniref:Alpha-amylase n=1 Tax=Pteromalus puparum TaxID=32389 RepID=A0A493QY97_9HYME|nr:alpha-amylase [Pteromalus puparum]
MYNKNLFTRLVLVGLVQVHWALAYDAAAYKDPHYAKGRTTMVHLFEWKYKDIAVECEKFLGPMGFGGIQLSPINENLVIACRPWYERYQSMSYKIVTRSGNEQEFADMVKRCNNAGVRTYVDAVINHMTGDDEPSVGTAGSRAVPKNRIYPGVPYNLDDFNPPCPKFDKNNHVHQRNCDIIGLHDLNQRKTGVRQKIIEFLNKAVDYGVAGFRIDAAKHMWPEDLKYIYEHTKNLRSDVFGKNKRPFIFQEIIDLKTKRNEAVVSKWEYNSLGAVIEFFFGLRLGKFFQGREELKHLEHWVFQDLDPLPSLDSLVMIDNHDNQRGHGASSDDILTYKKPRLYKMAIAFMLAHPYGHTRIMSSYDFSDKDQGPPTDKQFNIISPKPITGNVASGDDANLCDNGWICEHRWSQIYGMVGFRNVVQNANLVNWWSNDHNQIAFSRGNLGFIAFNGQYCEDLKQELQTGLPAGKYCDIISGRKVNGKCTGKTVMVDSKGKAYIEILKDEDDGVLAIHAGTKIGRC